MQVTGINSLSDNYLWIIHNSQKAWLVDPGEAQTALNFLAENQLELAGILITHHHWDHTDGVAEILAQHPAPVYANHLSPHAWVTHKLKEGDSLTLENIKFQILETPGHTLDHIAFVSDDWLFCGDTLFTGGCGRVFEGTAEQMATSLLKLGALSDNLKVYCGHEYTLANLNFAKIAEPDNSAIFTRFEQDLAKLKNNQPAVPSDLAQEKATNPFLRFNKEPVSSNISTHSKTQLTSPAELFSNLRSWKDALDNTGELEVKL